MELIVEEPQFFRQVMLNSSEAYLKRAAGQGEFDRRAFIWVSQILKSFADTLDSTLPVTVILDEPLIVLEALHQQKESLNKGPVTDGETQEAMDLANKLFDKTISQFPVINLKKHVNEKE